MTRYEWLKLERPISFDGQGSIDFFIASQRGLGLLTGGWIIERNGDVVRVTSDMDRVEFPWVRVLYAKPIVETLLTKPAADDVGPVPPTLRPTIDQKMPPWETRSVAKGKK